MDTGLAGKVAIITGGTGAIGRACAQAYHAEGAIVVIADLQSQNPQAVAASLSAGHEGPSTLGIGFDITRPEESTRLASKVVAAYCGIDVLLNCAGIFHYAPVLDLELTDWHRVLDVNLNGIFYCCQAVGRIMRTQGRGGKIVNIGSLAGQVGGLAAGADYSVSKAGVICLTKSLARGLAADHINVNSINPGPVESPMVDAWPEGQREKQMANIPLGRLGRPEDIAGAAIFLSSTAADYVHGAHLDVNGGILMD